MKIKRRRLNVENLDERIVPNATGFSIDFVPDNTNLIGESSSLFSAFGSSINAAETQILAAFQTWADVANINFNLVAGTGPNSSTPYADPSMSSAIHVSMEPLGAGVAAISSPVTTPSSLAGNMLLNSNQSFSVNGSSGTYDVYSVALHEVGVLLGLPENSTPSSVMDSVYQGVRTGLSAGDISAAQALYGAPVGNSFGGPAGNYTIQNAYNLGGPQGAYLSGRLLTQNETDYYAFNPNRQTTVNLQTSGLSLLEANLIVRNQSGTVITSASDPGNGNLSLIVPGQAGNYTIEVTGANGSALGNGRLHPVVPKHTDYSGGDLSGQHQQTLIAGNKTQLQVQATDADGANPIYSWSVASLPAAHQRRPSTIPTIIIPMRPSTRPARINSPPRSWTRAAFTPQAV